MNDASDIDGICKRADVLGELAGQIYHPNWIDARIAGRVPQNLEYLTMDMRRELFNACQFHRWALERLLARVLDANMTTTDHAVEGE